MKDELEQYWDGYFADARQAIDKRDARLLRMLERPRSADQDVAEILRQWRADHKSHPTKPNRPR